MIELLLLTLLWGGRKHKVSRKVYVQHPCDEGVGLPHLKNHRHAQRLAFLRYAPTEDSIFRGMIGTPSLALTSFPPFPVLSAVLSNRINIVSLESVEMSCEPFLCSLSFHALGDCFIGMNGRGCEGCLWAALLVDDGVAPFLVLSIDSVRYISLLRRFQRRLSRFVRLSSV